MKEDDREDLIGRIDNEGFDYAFAYYSDFEEIEDDEFHKLRNEFLNSRQKLMDYIGYEE